MSRFILCADDYAYNIPISEGILELVKIKKINAVSCMTLSPLWPEYAKKLKLVSKNIKIGLHFDLTSFCENKKSLKKIIIKNFIGLLNKEQLQRSIERQIELFFKYMGELPDFIDSHEHVHILSQVRDVVLSYYLKNHSKREMFIRLPLNKNNRNLKAKLIAFLGAKKLQKELEKFNIPHNKTFSGIYSLKPQENYAVKFQQFLNEIEKDGLIMCHPGMATEREDPFDPIAKARVNEYLYFKNTDIQFEEL